MKFGIFFLIGLWCLSLAAFGELSVDDLDKIRDIVKESEDRLRAENAASETRTNKQLDRNFTLLVALFGFVAVVTGIPLTLVALQLRKEQDRDEQLNQQRREIDTQRQLIETLQQQLNGMNRELDTLKQQRIFK